MGNEIASLFVTIGANVQGLVKGTTDAKTALSKVAQSFQQATGLSLGFTSATAAATKAVQMYIQYVKDSVQATVDYATAIDDMSRLTGNSAEDTSRLIQATDDLFISQSQLTAMLQGAARKGTDTSIDGLKRLATQYNNLNDVTEQNLFLIDKFGRSGLDMKKFMELGAGGIDTALGSVESYLVLSDEAVKQTIEYKRSVDGLQDSMSGFAYKMGQDAIPTLTDFNIVLTYLTNKAHKADVNLFDLGMTALFGSAYFTVFKNTLSRLADTISENNPGILDMNDSLEGTAEQAELAAEQIDELSKATLNIVDRMQGVEEDYQQSLADIASTEYATEQERIDAIKEVEAAHTKATRQIVLNYLEQLLAADGLTTQEMDFLLERGEQWGIYSEEVVSAAKIAMDEAAALAKSIQNIPNVKTITITAKYAQFGKPSSSESEKSDSQTTNREFAAGGSYQLSPFAGYEGVSMGGATASGNEVVSVSNQNQLNDMTSKLSEAIDEMRNLPATMQRAVRDGMLQAGA